MTEADIEKLAYDSGLSPELVEQLKEEAWMKAESEGEYLIRLERMVRSAVGPRGQEFDPDRE
ncbi:MAG TPA: hypothetical protein GXX28_03410 [Firmicutes bacterium]|nr:hypothetical protein [Bacillota bacterium]